MENGDATLGSHDGTACASRHVITTAGPPGELVPIVLAASDHPHLACVNDEAPIARVLSLAKRRREREREKEREHDEERDNEATTGFARGGRRRIENREGGGSRGIERREEEGESVG